MASATSLGSSGNPVTSCEICPGSRANVSARHSQSTVGQVTSSTDRLLLSNPSCCAKIGTWRAAASISIRSRSVVVLSMLGPNSLRHLTTVFSRDTSLVTRFSCLNRLSYQSAIQAYVTTYTHQLKLLLVRCRILPACFPLHRSRCLLQQFFSPQLFDCISSHILLPNRKRSTVCLERRFVRSWAPSIWQWSTFDSFLSASPKLQQVLQKLIVCGLPSLSTKMHAASKNLQLPLLHLLSHLTLRDSIHTAEFLTAYGTKPNFLQVLVFTRTPASQQILSVSLLSSSSANLQQSFPRNAFIVTLLAQIDCVSSSSFFCHSGRKLEELETLLSEFLVEHVQSPLWPTGCAQSKAEFLNFLLTKFFSPCSPEA